MDGRGSFDLSRLGERNVVDHPFAREVARRLGHEYVTFDYHYYDDPASRTGYRGYGADGNGNEGQRAFDDEADRLVAIPGVRRVLDVGCAKGFLVAALRARGVDAWGIDISPYAIANAPATVRPWLAVSTVQDWRVEAPYDLVHVAGVLLYLELTPLRQTLRRIHELCTLGASFEEPTAEHLLRLYDMRDEGALDALRNQELPAAAWAALYAEAGFARHPDGWYVRCGSPLEEGADPSK